MASVACWRCLGKISQGGLDIGFVFGVADDVVAVVNERRDSGNQVIQFFLAFLREKLAGHTGGALKQAALDEEFALRECLLGGTRSSI